MLYNSLEVKDSFTKTSSIILGFDFISQHGVVVDGAHLSVRFPNFNLSLPVISASSHSVIRSIAPSESHDASLLAQRDAVINRHPTLFDGKLGITSVASHRIDTGDAYPIKTNRILSSPAEMAEIDRQLDEMLRDDVIEPSSSPWASPVVLVRKADSSWRFAIDYRRVNDVTNKDASPLPLQIEFIDRLAGNQYFTTLDLKSGYWQIPVDSRDRPKTAVITHRGLFQFKRMPFGLCNAPATFQRCMQQVLGKLMYNGVVCYLDDILIYSRDLSSHLQLLDEVFGRLANAGFRLNLKKSKFLQTETRFLGHIVSRNGIRVDEAKVTAISNFPKPMNAASLSRFLGMASYLRRFVPHHAHLTATLSPLTTLGNAKDCNENKDKFDENQMQFIATE